MRTEDCVNTKHTEPVANGICITLNTQEKNEEMGKICKLKDFLMSRNIPNLKSSQNKNFEQ